MTGSSRKSIFQGNHLPLGLVRIDATGDFRGVEGASLRVWLRGKSAAFPLRELGARRLRGLFFVESPFEKFSVEVDSGDPVLLECRVRSVGRWEMAWCRAVRSRSAWPKGDLLGAGVEVIHPYSVWTQNYDTLDESDTAAIRGAVASLGHRPLFSVLMPAYNTDERWLRESIASVRRQWYPNWELVLVDDASTDPGVRRVLESCSGEPRIKTIFRAENGHISAASNSALELATGEFIALVDHDDVLREHALYMVAWELNRAPETDFLYSDEDLIDGNGRRYGPHFKPDWNGELALSYNLATHLSVFRTSVVRALGGFREGYEGAQDHDLALRVAHHSGIDRIRHIPHILYHWRAIPGSVAHSAHHKRYAFAAGRRAVADHLRRLGRSDESAEMDVPSQEFSLAFPPAVRYPWRSEP